MLLRITSWLALWLKTSLSTREVWSSIPGPVKSDTVSPPLRRFFGAVLSRRFAAAMDPAARYTLRRNTASIMNDLNVGDIGNLHLDGLGLKIRGILMKLHSMSRKTQCFDCIC